MISGSVNRGNVVDSKYLLNFVIALENGSKTISGNETSLRISRWGEAGCIFGNLVLLRYSIVSSGEISPCPQKMRNVTILRTCCQKNPQFEEKSIISIFLSLLILILDIVVHFGYHLWLFRFLVYNHLVF